MDTKVITVKDIGNIKLKKSQRAKLIHISIKPFYGVNVSVPKNCSFAQAEQLVYEKLSWIRKNLPKMQNIEQKKIYFDDNSSFTTKFHTLKISKHNNENVLVRIGDGLINIFRPEKLPVQHPHVQKSIQGAIETTWRLEAAQFLPVRLDELAKQHNFKFVKVGIRKSKSRWGSCSSINHINLSLYLMRLPNHLIDYVLLHELCHTVVKNHGPKFYELLEKVSGDAILLRKELHTYKPIIW